MYFDPLTETHFRDIAALMLTELQGSLAERGITLKWEETIPPWLAQRAAGGKRGARDLRNAVRREIEDRLASLLVERRCEQISGLLIALEGDTPVVQCV